MTLESDGSTNVKPPLERAGNPLAAMDYYGIYGVHLAEHPELRIPTGTKNKHNGHVKIVLMHYLAEQAAGLFRAEGKPRPAAWAARRADAVAARAQELRQAAAAG